MIHRAKFQNFKALREVEITFDSRLTVLVGPNGSGKTSVLQGIEFVYRLARGQSASNSSAFNSFARIPQVGIENVQELVKCRSNISSAVTLRIECVFDAEGGSSRAIGIECTRNAQQGETQRLFPANRTVEPIPGKALFLRLDPNLLSLPSTVTANPPLMHPSGAGLPSTLAFVALNQPDRFKLISDAFREIIPAIDRIRFDKQQTGAGYGDAILLDFRGSPNVTASHASNGTLCALGLLTSILGPDEPKVVLLDDLDHGLHPKAQMELVGVLRKLLAQFPDLQIIATSHSPYILNKLEWNEVRVTGLRDDGAAMCVRLEDHPEVNRWREAMTPGEFWSHAGDDWVTNRAKPAPATPEPATAAP